MKQLPLLTGLLHSRPFSERELLQIRQHFHVVHKGEPFCICSPQAILASLRGNGRPFCEDMPWNCPLNLKSQTPTV